MSLQDTPRGERLHIALFGKRNSGKSSLINALTNQEIAITSPVAGTTADPVFKAMELLPIGPCVFIDTAGFDDNGALGTLRVEKTRGVLEKTDVAILICADTELSQEAEWVRALREKKTPILAVINRIDERTDTKKVAEAVREMLGLEPVLVSAKTREGIPALLDALVALVPEGFDAPSIVGHLVTAKDVVLLVMPQDIQAPKGRLILPQVQVIRDLLDHACVTMCATQNELPDALKALREPPKLIVTDSQIFREVAALRPPESKLTSFSVLLARYKGDMRAFRAGAAAIDRLTEQDTVLIAEACTHKPLDGDIARVKLPRLLRKHVGEGLQIEVKSGADWGEDLEKYALIIHCGGCMFNRKYMLSRVAAAAAANVPITNYGVAIAKLTGILDQIED